MAELTLRQIRKTYGAMEVLHGIDLDIASGELVVFVGPSGCGKSTLLRCIAGLETISAGDMRIDGDLMNHVPPSRRGIAMVFQSYALYPHMSVYDNMAFSLKIAGAKKAEIDRQVRQAAERLQLTPYLDRVPKALSGGQRQRVAIGRAIVRNPKVFLFDEPLSNLDAALRVATRIEIAKLKASMPDTTMIYVTHDQVEAMTLADRIVVLKDGYIEQVGSPVELYRRPANLFVAQFIGSPAMNILPATILRSGSRVAVRPAAGGAVEMPLPNAAVPEGAPVSLGVRPEDLAVASEGEPLVEGRVDLIEQLGEVQLVYLDIGRDQPVVAKLPGNRDVARGTILRLSAPADHLHLFDADGRSLRRSAA